MTSILVIIFASFDARRFIAVLLLDIAALVPTKT